MWVFLKNRSRSPVSPYRPLTPCKKSSKSVQPFLRYLTLKNPAIWLVESFSGISRELEFSQTCGFLQKFKNHKGYHFSEKKSYIAWLVFPQNPKNLILSLILLNICWMWVFLKNRALSLFLLYHFTIPCKKLEQSDHGKYPNFCDVAD